MGLLRSFSFLALLSKPFYTPKSAYAGLIATFTTSTSRSEFEDAPAMIVYDSVDSTMNRAKDLLSKKVDLPGDHIRGSLDDDVFAVVSKHQSNGRGTRGRTWTSATGNLYMTLIVKKSKLPIPLTLVPLRVGTLIAPAIRKRISKGNVYLKWPNDVLIDDKKVCGTLIEIEDDRLLIGIGCNVGAAPEVPLAGADEGRPSTCVKDNVDAKEECPEPSAMALDIAQEIVGSTRAWIDAQQDTAEYVVNEFESNMNSGAVQMLRSGEDEGKEVIPLRINPDGTLLVQLKENKFIERTLIADYLW